ncbi:hypothetical protein OAU13_00790 [bacterium]|nr:hypothetical protein [bacterium]
MESKQQVRIGDVVKSLDFVGISNCYFVGVVTSVSLEDNTFRARTVKRVWEGVAFSEPNLPINFSAPLPGCHFFDDLAEEKNSEPRIQVVA